MAIVDQWRAPSPARRSAPGAVRRADGPARIVLGSVRARPFPVSAYHSSKTGARRETTRGWGVVSRAHKRLGRSPITCGKITQTLSPFGTRPRSTTGWGGDRSTPQALVGSAQAGAICLTAPLSGLWHSATPRAGALSASRLPFPPDLPSPPCTHPIPLDPPNPYHPLPPRPGGLLSPLSRLGSPEPVRASPAWDSSPAVGAADPGGQGAGAQAARPPGRPWPVGGRPAGRVRACPRPTPTGWVSQTQTPQRVVSRRFRRNWPRTGDREWVRWVSQADPRSPVLSPARANHEGLWGRP